MINLKIMKTTTIFNTGIALIIMLGLTINVNASKEPTSTTVSSMEESMSGSMQITVPSNMETFVSVLDQAGDMIYSDLVAKDEMAGKMYDFSEVENGTYIFKTVTQNKVVETTFVVDMNELNILMEEISYRPVFWIEDDMLSISFMNLNQDEVFVSVEDELPLKEEETVIYEETTESDMAYERVFDIQNLSEGEYTITLKTGENTYRYFFDK
jgi:hypothetical protein